MQGKMNMNTDLQFIDSLMHDLKKIALDLKEMKEALEFMEDIGTFHDERLCDIEDSDIESRILILEAFHNTYKASQRNLREVYDVMEDLSDRVLRLEEVLNKMVN